MESSQPTTLTRRAALRALGGAGMMALTAACSQSAPSTPTSAPKPTTAAVASPPSAPASSPGAASSPSAAASPVAATNNAAWNQLVASATGEKNLIVATYAGSGYRTFVDGFKAAFPGIEVEQNQFQSSSREFAPRLLQELKANLHTWDVAIMPPQEMLRQVRAVDGIDPIAPAIIRPDVLADASWVNGFSAGFYDTDRKWGQALTLSRQLQFWINTDLVKDGEVTTLKDILDPKWKGKILGGDPRTKGSAFLPATVMRLRAGDGVVKDLYQGQDVTLGTDNRQLTEMMVRGRFAIAVGAVDRVILQDFVAQGLGTSLKAVDIPEGAYVNSSNNSLWLMSKASHPNAAKLFANWALTKDAGALLATSIGDNSRRADVPPVDPATAYVPGVNYILMDAEEMLGEIEKTQTMAKDILN